MFPQVTEWLGKKAGSLSGGQQRLVEFARSLMLDPQLVILDEPSMGLAPKVLKSVFDAVRMMHAQGKTILLVEQNARAGLRLSTHGVVLENGQVRLAGTGQEVLDHPEIGALYLGGAVPDTGDPGRAAEGGSPSRTSRRAGAANGTGAGGRSLIIDAHCHVIVAGDDRAQRCRGLAAGRSAARTGGTGSASAAARSTRWWASSPMSAVMLGRGGRHRGRPPAAVAVDQPGAGGRRARRGPARLPGAERRAGPAGGRRSPGGSARSARWRCRTRRWPPGSCPAWSPPGLAGVEIPSSVGGRYLGDDFFLPFWEAAEATGALVFIHPTTRGFGIARAGRATTCGTRSGNPLETAMTAAHIAHGRGAGTLPAAAGAARARRRRAAGGPRAAAPGLRGPAGGGRPDRPAARTSRCAGSTTTRVTHDADLLADLVGYAGAGQVLLGSDRPFDMGTDDPVARGARRSAWAAARSWSWAAPPARLLAMADA